MPNKQRSQPIWLPTGNPDTTNISSTDFNAAGGQPGDLGQEFDYNDRVYQRVQLDSGTTASTGVGVVAANELAYWKDKTKYLVTNDAPQAYGGQTSNGFRNFVAGIFRVAGTAGNYVDILKAGDAIPVKDGSNSFTVGGTVIADSSKTKAAAAELTAGTAITYQVIGITRVVQAGGNVTVDVSIIDTP